jgi:hypothetical protein
VKRILVILFLWINVLNAQILIDIPEEELGCPFLGDTTVTICELSIMPEYPGGMDTFYKFLNKNLKVSKKDKCQSEKLIATFNIDVFGNATDIKVVKGNCQKYIDETMRVLSIMPRWKPGSCGGKPLQVSYRLPLIFNAKK